MYSFDHRFCSPSVPQFSYYWSLGCAPFLSLLHVPWLTPSIVLLLYLGTYNITVLLLLELLLYLGFPYLPAHKLCHPLTF